MQRQATSRPWVNCLGLMAISAALTAMPALAGGTDTAAGAVTGEAVDEFSDRAILERVQAALAGDAALRGAAIEVEVRHGIVSLSGRVNSDAERRAAGQAAVRVAGVLQVINTLEVA